MRYFLTSLLFISFSNPAFAHVGHVGELAGHAHWVGLGALVVAGALATWVGVKAKSKTDEAPEGEAIEEEAEQTPSGA